MINHYKELSELLNKDKDIKTNKVNKEFLTLLNKNKDKDIKTNKVNKEFLTLLKKDI